MTMNISPRHYAAIFAAIFAYEESAIAATYDEPAAQA